jgi:glyoxylase-like metal-dependent hydrolase (beta-lactamase superfamily II)
MADIHTTLVHHPIEPGEIVSICPLVQRLTANNASPFTGPGTNTYIVGSAETEFVVIDPGPNEQKHIDAILAATSGNISAILVTHCHDDHSPAALPLKQSTGATLVGLPVLQPSEYLDSTFVPEIILEDGLELEYKGFRLRSIYTPGHLKQHMCFFLEQEKMLFTGDHIMQGATVTIVPPHGGSMTDYLKSLQKLHGQNIEFLAPAHGHILSNAEMVMTELYTHRINRENAILDVLEKVGKGTVKELSPMVYPELIGEITMGAKAMLWAHLQKLVDDGKATRYREKHWLLGDDVWQIVVP